ncbi:MAG: type II secretion system protein GspM [Nevskiales bacterium]
MIEKLRQRFLALNLRERLLVGAAAITVIVALLFLLIWEPLHDGVKRLRGEVATTQALVAELSQARGLVLSGRGGAGVIQGQGRSLLAIVDQTGKENGLGSAITRMQPEGDATVRVWLEQADFAALLRWLHALENTYGVTVVEAAIDREAQSGLVRARLGLARGTP